MDIALKGTKNVMNAAAEARVRRVVYTSTMGTVHMDPNRSPDKVLDETCWSDLKYLKSIQDWYSYAKVLDEQTAWSVASERGMDLVTVIPPAVVGAMLQPTVNASISHVRKFLNGTNKMYSNAVLGYVHARDLALAHILVYEIPSAFGRYLCTESVAHRREIAEMLIKMFPEYPIPTKCSDNIKPTVKAYKFTNQRLKDLGMKFTPLRQGLYDSVKSLQEKGHLSVPSMSKNSHHIHGHQSNVSKLAAVLNNAARSRL